MQTTAKLQKMIGEWTDAINDRSIQDVLTVADPEGLWVRLWDILGDRLTQMQGRGAEDSLPKAAEGAAESSSAVNPKPSVVDPPPVVERTPPTPPVEPEVRDVNSSTHRKEHARLTRKMMSLPEAEFPHMHKLWAGNRQDSYVSSCGFPQKLLFSRTVYTTDSTYIPTNRFFFVTDIPGKTRVAESLDFQWGERKISGGID